MIISLLNHKRGVGKTTISINLAGILSYIGNKVLLIDADPHRRSLNWAVKRKHDLLFNTIAIDQPIIHKEIDSFIKSYDYIIIDGASGVYDVTRSVIAASNLVLIPVQPSLYDVWASSEIVAQINEVSRLLSEIKNINSSFVINRKIRNTAIGQDVYKSLLKYNMDLLITHIHSRTTFAESVTQGLCVHELGNKRAKIELDVLVKELLKKYNRRVNSSIATSK